MSAILKYGSYTHQPNSVMLDIVRRGMSSRMGRMFGVKETWNIKGVLMASSASALSTLVDQLQAAYSQNGYDIEFSITGGIVHKLLNSDCIGGVQVVQFLWLGSGPRGSGVEGLFRRTYQIVVEGMKRVGASNLVLEYQDQIRYIGTGGTRVLRVESLAGDPQPQNVCLYTTSRAIQSGYAVGLTTWPTPAAPKWHGYGRYDRYMQSFGTPRFIGSGSSSHMLYPVTWRYEYEAEIPFVGSLVPDIPAI